MKNFSFVYLIFKNLVVHVLSLDLIRIYNVGFILASCYLFQILTGVLLALIFYPNLEASLPVLYVAGGLASDFEFEFILQSGHIIGCTAVFMALFGHIAKLLFLSLGAGIGLALLFSGISVFFLTVVIAFLGYVLPLSQMSYWGLVVFSNILASIPGVGSAVLLWLWGGEFISSLSLSKIFVFHVVFPVATLFLALAHIHALHVGVSTDAFFDGVGLPWETVLFSCKSYFSDLGAFIATCLVFGGVVLFYWDFVFHEESFQPFDPFKTSAKIIPEWFFLGLFGALKSLPSKFGGVLWLVLLIFSILLSSISAFSFSFLKGGFKDSVYILSIYIVVSIIGGHVLLVHPMIEYLLGLNLVLFNGLVWKLY